MSSKALKEKLDSLKKIWDAQSTTYINTKPSAEKTFVTIVTITLNVKHRTTS